jgi:serine/threonine-protein kinase
MISSPLTPEEDVQLERAKARVGSVLVGKWQLETLLGIGGMAAVYAATHNNGSRVAIKILHGELAHVVEAKERFLEEAYAANRVQHSGAVHVLDDGVTEDGCAFLVMELLEGETLDARLARAGRTLSALEVLSSVDALLDVLSAAHEVGMIHRDVKPENVFLTTSGQVKLLDFGIARMRETRRTLRTETGATMGTPAFMSPEQARGRWEQLDGRADLWSVGATMFVLLTGRLVHQAETTNEQLLAAMTQPAPALRSVAPLVPGEIAEVVDKALATVPEDRFANAREMQAAVRAAHRRLAELAAAEGRTSQPPVAGGPIEPPLFEWSAGSPTYRPVTTSSTPTHRSRRTLVVAALGLGLMALGVAGVAWGPELLGHGASAQSEPQNGSSPRSGERTGVSAGAPEPDAVTSPRAEPRREENAPAADREFGVNPVPARPLDADGAADRTLAAPEEPNPAPAARPRGSSVLASPLHRSPSPEATPAAPAPEPQAGSARKAEAAEVTAPPDANAAAAVSPGRDDPLSRRR